MFESVVKALFDIKSDFVNIEVYMGCDAIVVVDTDKIRIVLLYQSVFHLGVIGATYLTDDFLAPCPNFFQRLITHMSLYHIPLTAIRLFALLANS